MLILPNHRNQKNRVKRRVRSHKKNNLSSPYNRANLNSFRIIVQGWEKRTVSMNYQSDWYSNLLSNFQRIMSLRKQRALWSKHQNNRELIGLHRESKVREGDILCNKLLVSSHRRQAKSHMTIIRNNISPLVLSI